MLEQSNDIEKQKAIVTAFVELKEATESLRKKMNQAGWSQRNELITHVNSEYNNHEKLISQKSKWEQITFLFKVHDGLLTLLTKHRDLYGYFPDYSEMINSFDSLINTAAGKEEFEIAKILKTWRDKFPNP